MKTTKSILYGLLLVTGLVACSKEYNSNPASNSGAFGGTNPVAPITGAAANEIVFKENGQTIRLKEAKYLESGNIRTVTGISGSGTEVISYSLSFKQYGGLGIYNGTGKPADSFYILKQKGDISNPGTQNFISYYSGSLSKEIPGYAYAKVTDTAGEKMVGEFTGRIIRRNALNVDEDFGEFLDITSGFFNASKFVP
jgi:hypothetical protein